MPVYSQTQLSGTIKSGEGDALANVSVRISNTEIVNQSDDYGNYTVSVPSHRVTVVFSKVGFQTARVELDLSGKSFYFYEVILKPEARLLGEVSILENRYNINNSTRIDPGISAFLPSVSGNFEAILKTLPGISANNELSSQYTVRGGNFDENLVYINDIEIYRPFMVRNGQQEGLSFINPELADEIRFSGGGFEARYGDKMSSVLDVHYGEPDSTQVTGSAGILGYSATLKYVGKGGKAYLLTGFRQKFNQSILKSQSTKGSYDSDFYDLQLLYHRQLSGKLSIGYLGNYNLSKFQLIPASGETEFGTLESRLRLQVIYDGIERDRYRSFMNGLTFTFKPSEKVHFKWINSAFSLVESEMFDIEGRYLLDEVTPKTNVSSVGANKAIGSSRSHARNSLRADIFSTEVKAYFQNGSSFLESGLRYQYDHINDRLHEYTLVDSAGFTIPGVSLTDMVSSANRVSTSRAIFYVQDVTPIASGLTLSAGVRGNYSSRSRQFLISPRATLSYQPRNKTEVLYRFSAGLYSQPRFYREMRNFYGQLAGDQRAQRSLHLLAALDKNMVGGGVPIKFTSEVYYKALWDLVPYKVENLRIRYFADQLAKGYATGVDFSVSGEFIDDMESSFRLSLMKTMEDIHGDYYMQQNAAGNPERVEPGFLKRPTDQRINASAFFQDKLFTSPSNKVHLSFLYGAALPIGPPQTQRYRDVFKIPAYKRADIGFSKDFLDASLPRRSATLQKYFSSLIIYAGVFNLLDNNNTVSYLWLKDIYDNQYAIPNYLTGRQLSFKLIVKLK